VLALALALIQSTVPMLGARLRDPALMNVARSTALAQLLSCVRVVRGAGRSCMSGRIFPSSKRVREFRIRSNR